METSSRVVMGDEFAEERWDEGLAGCATVWGLVVEVGEEDSL